MVDAIDSRLGGLNCNIKASKSDIRHGFAFFIAKYN